MGWRVRWHLSRLERIGLANDYLSYVTTPEEFWAQAYEGASNLFGLKTGPVLEAQLAELSSRIDMGGGGAPVKLESCVAR
jgi:hypothetical protein